MSSSAISEHEEPDEINVIPVTGFRTKEGRFEHRVPPVSQTAKAQKYLENHPDVHLPADAIQRIVHGAVEPDQLEGIRVERLRVATGWLMAISYRAYSTMVSLAFENDRLLADNQYAADPHAQDHRKALAMPQAHHEHAVLLHTDSFKDVLDTVDRSAERVLVDNPQDVGSRIVQRPLMLVPSALRDDDGHWAVDVTAVDGNCRLSACYAGIPVAQGWVNDVLTGKERDKRKPLLPSHLMQLSLEARRGLTRKVVRTAHHRLAKAKTGTDYDRRARNQAVIALNAITIPAQAIVGYVDDEPHRGMQRFPVAVRTLLRDMNVDARSFKDEAKNAVSAEEIIVGLHDEGMLGDGTEASALRDALIGRGNVAGAMERLGLDPLLPDLRFALVIQQLTHKSVRFNALMRAMLGNPDKLHLSRRNGPVIELGLRSYSSGDTRSTRLALETGCLWQDLVDEDWTVENINTDEKVNDLLEQAETKRPAALLLGTLGMIALVMSGRLLAAAGSAETIAEATIDRGSVGHIIRKLLETRAGRRLLADAVKKFRAGEPLQWYDEKKDELVAPPDNWKGSTYNAHLRRVVRHGFKDDLRSGTPVDREANALTLFQDGITEADGRLRDLADLRKQNLTTERIPWIEVEAAFKQIRGLTVGLRSMSEPEPISW